MNLLRSVLLVRSIVFVMIGIVLFDSVDPPDALRTATKKAGTSHLTFVDKAAYEYNEEDKEGRMSELTHINLYRTESSGAEIPALSCIIIKSSLPDVLSNFTSIASDLPSPPPKG